MENYLVPSNEEVAKQIGFFIGKYYMYPDKVVYADSEFKTFLAPGASVTLIVLWVSPEKNIYQFKGELYVTASDEACPYHYKTQIYGLADVKIHDPRKDLGETGETKIPEVCKVTIYKIVPPADLNNK